MRPLEIMVAILFFATIFILGFSFLIDYYTLHVLGG